MILYHFTRSRPSPAPAPAAWYNNQAYDRYAGSVLDPEALNAEPRKRIRDEYDVFPEFIAVEFERVMRVAFAPPQAERESSKATASAPYRVLGSAPAGERCDACGKAGGARISLDGRVYVLHKACADSYLAAMVDTPVKIPEQPDEPDDADGWSFNNDVESQGPFDA